MKYFGCVQAIFNAIKASYTTWWVNSGGAGRFFALQNSNIVSGVGKRAGGI